MNVWKLQTFKYFALIDLFCDYHDISVRVYLKPLVMSDMNIIVQGEWVLMLPVCLRSKLEKQRKNYLCHLELAKKTEGYALFIADLQLLIWMP